METNESPCTDLLPALLDATPQGQIACQTTRHDGWTVERQRRFCECLAETGRVVLAARAAGMSKGTAYRLRRSPRGRGFALAWDAALTLAHQMIVDEAVELAMEGTHELIVRDGVTIAERRKRDSKAMLDALGRLENRPRPNADAVQIVAGDFDAFLDLMEQAGADAEEDITEFMLERGGKRPKQPLARNSWGQFLPQGSRS